MAISGVVTMEACRMCHATLADALHNAEPRGLQHILVPERSTMWDSGTFRGKPEAITGGETTRGGLT